MDNLPEVSRRKFLGTATGAAATFMITSPKTAFGSEANSQLKLGLVGCGSRGPWIANFFQQHTNTKCVAVHDYFRNQVEIAGAKLDVPEDRQYIGLDGYKELLASDVDAVAVTRGPGLPGSLVVGLNLAKGLALGGGLPLIGVNHLVYHDDVLGLSSYYVLGRHGASEDSLRGQWFVR